MKKAYILFAGILLLAAGCAKEVDNKADVTTDNTITITASVDDQATRSQTALDGTTDKYKFTWANDEKISVVPSGVQKVLTFDVVDPTNGTFAYTPRPDDDQTYNSFIMAVSPQAALGEVVVAGESATYEIRYIGSYFQEESNAIMVAGTPTTGSDGNQHFNFKHVGALVKVSYANVPAGGLPYGAQRRLEIVRALAERNNVNIPEEELLAMADKWELAHGGLSGRTAQQFVDHILGTAHKL